MGIKRIVTCLFVLCQVSIFYPWNALAQRSDSLTVQALRELDIPFTKGNEIHPLPNGQLFFDDLFQYIQEAKRYIHIEFYKFYNDSIGNATLNLLQEKANQGVEVKIIIDGFGNFSKTHSFSKEDMETLNEKGIQMIEFDPFRFPYINHAYHRDHRKIVIVDGNTAYIGGMNIADYYIHGKPAVGDWCDMQVRMHGPTVLEYERLFTHMWNRITNDTIQPQLYVGENKSQEDVLMGVVAKHPGKRSELMRQAFIAAIDAAHQSIKIVNAYPLFIPSVRKAIYRALERGVQVEIMLSSNNDQRFSPNLMALDMKKLMERGASIYYFEGGFHHAKVMMVDDLYCTVGSTNLDARAMMFDHEINAFVFDKKSTQKFINIFEFDKRSRCILLTPEIYAQRFSWKFRATGRLCFFMRPFL